VQQIISRASKVMQLRPSGFDGSATKGLTDLFYFTESRSARARSRVHIERRTSSCSSLRNVPLGSRRSWQAMRWIGKSKRPHSSGTAKPALVCVVDDDRWSREGINCYLDSCGYNCAAFRTAEDYLSADAVGETACLVADVHLPGMWGPELQQRLIADGYRIPIIFVTGYFDERTRDRVLRAGAIAYLAKPWCEKTLSGCLEKALRVAPT
jgi:CheY-like chemotaxis protein